MPTIERVGGKDVLLSKYVKGNKYSIERVYDSEIAKKLAWRTFLEPSIYTAILFVVCSLLGRIVPSVEGATLAVKAFLLLVAMASMIFIFAEIVILDNSSLYVIALLTVFIINEPPTLHEAVILAMLFSMVYAIVAIRIYFFAKKNGAFVFEESS